MGGQDPESVGGKTEGEGGVERGEEGGRREERKEADGEG